MTSNAAESQHSHLPEPPLGLRERKKRRTREGIRREAYRLFREQGYDATTVDQIADAAEVSPSTFFRYFATKEDVVLTDEYDPLIMQALRDAPAEASLVETVLYAVAGPLRGYMAEERGEMQIRLRLMADEPAIRARAQHHRQDALRQMAEVFAERMGLPATDLRPRYAAAAIEAVLEESLQAWTRAGFEGDPAEFAGEALEFLAGGLK